MNYLNNDIFLCFSCCVISYTFPEYVLNLHLEGLKKTDENCITQPNKKNDPNPLKPALDVHDMEDLLEWRGFF